MTSWEIEYVNSKVPDPLRQTRDTDLGGEPKRNLENPNQTEF